MNIISIAANQSYNSKRRLAKIKQCLLKGADINAAGKGGDTALIISCRRGSGSLVSFLIANGADVNLPNEAKKSALHYAVTNRQSVEVVNILLKAGANLELKDEKGKTAKQIAQSLLNHEMVSFINSYEEQSKLDRTIISDSKETRLVF